MLRKSWVAFVALVLAGVVTATAVAQERERRDRPRRRERREVVHPKVGEVLKDFALKNAKGKTVTLSDFRNKKIFVLELGACT